MITLDRDYLAPGIRRQLLDDVLTGLSASRKHLPSRWLYDRHGSELFEEITALAEYYPTRAETALLRSGASAMAEFMGLHPVLIEYGAGAGIKTEILLDAIGSAAAYVPIDVAEDFLLLSADRLRSRYPALPILPVVADFTAELDLGCLPTGPRAAFFPGCTIGNLDADQAGELLRRMLRHVGANGRALIGVDLVKSLGILLPAYDDREGVTAEFNLNLLRRLNRELGADFDVESYAHEARWNPSEAAVEMHLVSLDEQDVHIEGRSFSFEAGESIHTESSRKYQPAQFVRMAIDAGWTTARTWTDVEHGYCVFGLAAPCD